MIYNSLFLIFSTITVSAVSPPRGKSIGQGSENDSFSANFERQERVLRDVQTPPQGKSASDQVVISKSAPVRPKAILKKPQKSEATNLPGFYLDHERSHIVATEGVVYVPKNTPAKLKSVRAGDVFSAVIDQKIVASPGVVTPIRAQIISGSLKGGYFVGEATLDKELKRVLLEFTKVRSLDGEDSVFSVKASGLSPDGSIGLIGSYHSQEGAFFVGELLAAGAAGYMDATIQRNQTLFGNSVATPTVDNAAKAGAVSALSKTADRMAERSRNAPEYTETGGFSEIKVIVLDTPVLNNQER